MMLNGETVHEVTEMDRVNVSSYDVQDTLLNEASHRTSKTKSMSKGILKSSSSKVIAVRPIEMDSEFNFEEMLQDQPAKQLTWCERLTQRIKA